MPEAQIKQKAVACRRGNAAGIYEKAGKLKDFAFFEKQVKGFRMTMQSVANFYNPEL